MNLEESSYQLLPIDNLLLDKKNPRIAKWIEIYGDEINAEGMSLALGASSGEGDSDGTTFISLRESIKINKGIIHPIIVNKQIDSNFVVIEGNTRALIYKEFREKKVPGNWNKIPSIVYNNLNDGEIDAIRLQAHLVGPRAWDPYSKAKYLNFLSTCEYLTIDQIVSFCGGKKTEIIDYISAFNDMESFYRPILDSDSDFDPTRFSAFVELQRPRITESLLKHKFNKSDFSKWVITQKLSPLASIRQLPKILDNEKAREVFLKNGASSAIKLLDVVSSGTTLSDASLIDLAQELIKKIQSLSYAEFKRLKDPSHDDEKGIILMANEVILGFSKELTSSE